MKNDIFKKLVFAIVASVMLFITIASAVSAYYYPDLPNVQPNYLYYQGYDNIPVVMGPFPRYYIGMRDVNPAFAHDDFNHYDDFVGYNDLDVYYPAQGRLDVLRNPSAGQLDLSQINTSMKLFGEHVSGYIPGGGLYTKHYMHEHEWEMDGGYGYGYGYYAPVAYRNKPIYTHPCQVRSICEATHSCCN